MKFKEFCKKAVRGIGAFARAMGRFLVGMAKFQNLDRLIELQEKKLETLQNEQKDAQKLFIEKIEAQKAETDRWVQEQKAEANSWVKEIKEQGMKELSDEKGDCQREIDGMKKEKERIERLLAEARENCAAMKTEIKEQMEAIAALNATPEAIAAQAFQIKAQTLSKTVALKKRIDDMQTILKIGQFEPDVMEEAAEKVGVNVYWQSRQQFSESYSRNYHRVRGAALYALEMYKNQLMAIVREGKAQYILLGGNDKDAFDAVDEILTESGLVPDMVKPIESSIREVKDEIKGQPKKPKYLSSGKGTLVFNKT
ncbi:hypothetical protein FACS189425_01590 [Clostridia bacterium]|nr:hypothetical protein FACS189425_01590 [Clostridia bacterium]